jgi:hypothetical protein
VGEGLDLALEDLADRVVLLGGGGKLTGDKESLVSWVAWRGRVRAPTSPQQPPLDPGQDHTNPDSSPAGCQ